MTFDGNFMDEKEKKMQVSHFRYTRRRRGVKEILQVRFTGSDSASTLTLKWKTWIT